MFVKDWMSRPACAIGPHASAASARNLMHRRRIRRLAVVDRGHLVGIVTRSDIEASSGKTRRRSLLEQCVLQDKKVEDVMTPNPVFVAPDETLEGAAVAMTSRRISGLPVVDEGKVVGMITETDVFRALIDLLGFNEGGARVVLDLQSPESLVRWLEKFSRGPQIRSLVTYREPASRRWKAVVRLWGKRLPAGRPAQEESVAR
jgi:acetoin utilization protein AcuB